MWRGGAGYSGFHNGDMICMIFPVTPDRQLPSDFGMFIFSELYDREACRTGHHIAIPVNSLEHGQARAQEILQEISATDSALAVIVSLAVLLAVDRGIFVDFPIYRTNSSSSLVGVERFELPTLWSQTRCATRLRYTPPRRWLGNTRFIRSPQQGNSSLFSRDTVEQNLRSSGQRMNRQQGDNRLDSHLNSVHFKFNVPDTIWLFYSGT